VLAGACAALTTLAGKEDTAAQKLASTAAVYLAMLQETSIKSGGGTAQNSQLLCRFLFILGQLCRRGADVLESTTPEAGGVPLAMADCQRVFVQFCTGAQPSMKVSAWLRFWMARYWSATL
jgi:hypothetical protein